MALMEAWIGWRPGGLAPFMVGRICGIDVLSRIAPSSAKPSVRYEIESEVDLKGVCLFRRRDTSA